MNSTFNSTWTFRLGTRITLTALVLKFLETMSDYSILYNVAKRAL